jgi:ribosomal protein S4
VYPYLKNIVKKKKAKWRFFYRTLGGRLDAFILQLWVIKSILTARKLVKGKHLIVNGYATGDLNFFVRPLDTINFSKLARS